MAGVSGRFTNLVCWECWANASGRHNWFPNGNVFENIAYGLKIKKLSSSDIRRRVAEALSLTDLTGLEQRPPTSSLATATTRRAGPRLGHGAKGLAVR
jgi:ABC-type taurine transport system ATPase subunit